MMKLWHALSQKKIFRIILLLVLTVFVLVNTCATLMSDKFGLRLDMTGEKLYSLSEQTHQMVSLLSSPIKIQVVCKEIDYPAMLQEVLDRYSRLSDNIAVSYVDPFTSPAFISHYKQLGYTLQESDILVEGEQGVRHIPSADTLVYKDGEPVGIQIEQQITSALLYVNNPQKRTAAFTTGHSERGSNALEKLFTANNFQIQNINLGTVQSVSADVLVIASPSKDFTPSEITTLEAFMGGGGKLMLFLEPGMDDYPQLEDFLATWNLTFDDNVVLEEKAYVSDNPLNLMPRYAPHEINLFFTDNQYSVVMPSTRGISILNSDIGAISTKQVLLSTPDSYAKESMQYDTVQRENTDKAGPFILAVIAEKEVLTSDGINKATIFAAGSRYVYADDILEVPSYANRDFLTQTINYLTQTSSAINIPPKTLVAPTLSIQLHQSVAIGVVLVIVCPLAVIAAGIFVYVKRKNL